MEQQFDLQSGSKDRSTSGHPFAPPRVAKHIRRKPVADLQVMPGLPTEQLLQEISLSLPSKPVQKAERIVNVICEVEE